MRIRNYRLIWGSNTPVKYQFSTSLSGPWHDTMAANDKYRRDSTDGGTTWGSAYQFRGEDGRPGSNGSDASVTYDNVKRALQKASSIDTAYLTMNEVGAPQIYGGEIVGGTITGGKILSDSVINVKTDAKIGDKLILNANNLLGGIEFRFDDGETMAEIYVDAAAKSMHIAAPAGGLYINGQKYERTAVFA